VVYRSVNRDGQTFGLDARSVERVREGFSDRVRVHPRVFIAHDRKAAVEAVDSELFRQVVQLLTGVSLERLEQSFGQISLLDSATEQLIEPVDR